jgi:Xaa-Pro aminopeptidase
MRADLDRLMADRGLDAIVVFGSETFSAPHAYLTRGAHVTGGCAIKTPGAEPVLFVNPMEIEEGRATGLTAHSYHEFGWAEVLREQQGDRARADVVMIGRYLAHLGIRSGRIGLYGDGAIHQAIEFVRLLREAHPAIDFVGELGVTLFDEAYMTKDADEIARLRAIGERTAHVVAQTWDFLAAHRAADGIVVGADGAPLTIGAVKRFVRRALLDQDLEESGMIFAQGRDAGFPHSRGAADQPLRTGQAIVFDLFPRESGGGLFHDMTRTWCLGYAPPEVQAAYEQVMTAFDIAVASFRLDQPAARLQEAVLDYFEAQGHPTGRSHPGTTDGYVHSLGHGIGLNIHERPSISHLSKDTLRAGCAITIEPGLYYPERGFGVRIEDSFIVGADGALVSLTPFRKDLIVPLRG